MPYLAWNAEGFGGYWGNGDTEEQAVANWKTNGGRGKHILMKVHDAYERPFIDDWGNPRGYPTQDLDDMDPDEWPRFDQQVFLVGPRGGRTDITDRR